MTGGHGTYRDAVNPDIVLLLAGTNDLGAGAKEPELEKRMTGLLTWLKTNRPQAQVFVGTVPPRGMNKNDYEAYNVAIVEFNAWMTSTLPTLGAHYW